MSCNPSLLSLLWVSHPGPFKIDSNSASTHDPALHGQLCHGTGNVTWKAAKNRKRDVKPCRQIGRSADVKVKDGSMKTHVRAPVALFFDLLAGERRLHSLFVQVTEHYCFVWSQTFLLSRPPSCQRLRQQSSFHSGIQRDFKTRTSQVRTRASFFIFLPCGGMGWVLRFLAAPSLHFMYQQVLANKKSTQFVAERGTSSCKTK